jgi:hypothetical protein
LPPWLRVAHVLGWGVTCDLYSICYSLFTTLSLQLFLFLFTFLSRGSPSYLEMAMGKYPPGITTPYSYPRHKNNPTGLPIYAGGYGFTPIPIPMWVWVTHRVTRTQSQPSVRRASPSRPLHRSFARPPSPPHLPRSCNRHRLSLASLHPPRIARP